jgi:glycosyltransferase involved in cell wall biosynthesis
MNIWLFQIGEPLPIDNEGKERLLRTGMFADYLMHNNHKIIWWTSTFYHQKKILRYNKNEIVEITPNYHLVLLNAIPYKKNVSIERLINHYQLKVEFTKKCNTFAKPDVILASYPSIELTLSAVKYASQNNIPIIIDIRDLWPEVFIEILPRLFRRVGKSLFFPYYRMAIDIFKRATAIIGLTDEFIEWGLSLAHRERSHFDQVFPMCYENDLANIFNHRQDKESEDFFGKMQINFEKFIICFFGTLGQQFSLLPVFQAINLLERKNYNVQLIICGDGPKRNYLEQQAQKLSKQIIFTGWINKDKIQYLLKKSKVGLAPYKDSNNFLYNLPNKPIEYLSAGLPIASSIKGVLGNLIEKENIGVVYDKPNDLAEKIINFINDPKLLTNMSYNAKELFSQQFSSEKVHKLLEEFLMNFMPNCKLAETKAIL